RGEVDTGGPGHVAACPRLELRPERERKWSVDLGLPQELIRLLCGVVGRGRLGTRRVEPTGDIGECARERDTGSALPGRLRGRQQGLGDAEVGGGTGDVD